MIYSNKAALIQAHIRKSDLVLDVGFLGQGIRENDLRWPHALLRQTAKGVCGVDLELADAYKADPHYRQASAEDFNFEGVQFDAIFAGDLIEHLSNPGLFIECCKRQLAPGGRLILTTPNTFNLFNIAEKISKGEPTVNLDHTFYFNSKVLRQLLQKNGMEAAEVSYVYSLEYSHKESLKKKFLNFVYWSLSKWTDKYVETLVIIAVVK